MSNRQNSKQSRNGRSSRSTSNNRGSTQRKGRGHGTKLQREAARQNPWIRAVRRHSKDTGMTFRDAMVDLAGQKRSGSKRKRGSKY